MGGLVKAIEESKSSYPLTAIKEVYQPTQGNPLEKLHDYLNPMVDRMVFIIRNPAHTIASQLAVIGPDFSMWLGRMIDFCRYVDELESDHVVLRYDDLVSDPIGFLNKAVAGFGRVEGDPVLKPFKGFGDWSDSGRKFRLSR